MTLTVEDHDVRGAPKLAFAQAGEGPDVVLIHGAMTGLQDMAIGLFDSLEREFRATAFDRPGHGGSLAVPGGSPQRQADAIHASVQALGLKRPVVVGHSFGGAVALAYGLRYPEETAGIVALSPISFPEPRLEQVLFSPRVAPGPLGFWNHSMGRMTDPLLLPVLWRAMFLPQTMPKRFAEAFPFSAAGRAEQMLSEGRDASSIGPGVALNAAAYRDYPLPVHVLAGDRDMVVNTRVHAEGLARLLPRGRLTTLPGLGHMIHHFAQADIVQSICSLSSTA